MLTPLGRMLGMFQPLWILRDGLDIFPMFGNIKRHVFACVAIMLFSAMSWYCISALLCIRRRCIEINIALSAADDFVSTWWAALK